MLYRCKPRVDDRQPASQLESLHVMPTLKRTFVRDMPDRSRIVANAELRDDSGSLSPGFAITCAIYEPHGTWSGAARHRNGRDSDAGGADHAAILRAFPELKPLVDVHLCAPDGTPMHALANGWYFYSGGASSYRGDYNPGGLTDHERAACALHIPASDLPEDLDETAFGEFVASLAPRWAEAAATARAILEAGDA